MEAISLSRKQEQFDVPFTGELPKLILVTEKLVLFKLAFLLIRAKFIDFLIKI